MRKVIINAQYQLPEFPSVPYSPYNFWRTMALLDGVEIVEGKEPPPPSRLEGYLESPYKATFFITPQGVVLHYSYSGLHEATVTLVGKSESVNDVEKIIRDEHRRLDEKLRERKSAA